MRIASVARALPAHCYRQEEIRAELEEVWSDRPSVTSRLGSLLENVRVEQRYLAQPLEDYVAPRSFGESNDLWIRVAMELGEEALTAALAKVGLGPRDIDTIFSVSVTGLASPSLEVRIGNRMGFREDVKRVPIFGLGCVAGAAGLARAADYLRAFPDQVAVLLSVELCSLTFQIGDTSLANVISCGLFGDGAAAVVLVGEQRAEAMGLDSPRILDTRSILYPDTEQVMGWRISERGFDIVLSPAVPTIAEERVPPGVDKFLGEHRLTRADIATWVCHPGGPKVLSALSSGLGLRDEDVRLAWKVLAEQGNLSSTSVLMVLEETLAAGAPSAGAHGLVLAMGPAFCSELVLFQWGGGEERGG